MTVVIIIILALAALAVTVFFTVRWLRRLRSEAIAFLHGRTREEKVYHVEDCNFFGLLSAGYAQMRGNGVLALTDRGIHFRMLTPAKYVFVSLDSITGVSQPRSFLGKTKAKVLLRVDFTGGAGEDDAGAWLVRSLDWWTEALEALRSGVEPPPAPWKRKGPHIRRQTLE
jgi:hypothetical protein